MVSPIFERELGRTLRQPNALRTRFLTAVIAVAVSSLFIFFGGGGAFLCSMLGWCGCFLIVLEAGRMTRYLFTEDRQNGMLGLIFLTGISPTEMFWARLGGASLVALQQVIALVPLLSIPFLMGGVSQQVFIGMVLAMPVLFLFVLSVCVLASFVGTDDASTKLWAFLIGGLICAVAPAFHWADRFVGGRIAGGDTVLLLSPAYGPYLLQNRFAAAGYSELLGNFALTLSWSVLFFALSAWLLKRSLRERVLSPRMLRWRAIWRRFVHGGKEWRQRAAGWLEENPFLWLAAHDRQPVTLAWTLFSFVVAGWLILWALWPDQWPGVGNFFLTALLLNCTMGVLSGYTTAKRISEDRRSGILEVLLTTPLTTQEIVEGQLRASAMQFRPLCRVVFALNVLMMLAGLLTRSWSSGALLVYAICWVFLLWYAWQLGGTKYRLKAMWAGLNTGQPSYAIKTELYGVAVNSIQLVFNFRSVARHFSEFPTGSTLEIVFVLLGAAVVVVILIVQSRAKGVDLRFRLIEEMRSIAEEPAPAAGDPRLKKWQLTTRLGESK